MWGSSGTTCSSSTAADIQSRMEKYLNNESHEFDDDDNRCRVGDRPPRIHHDFSTSSNQTSSSAEVKPTNSNRFLHSDVLDLHKEGDAAGSAGATVPTATSSGDDVNDQDAVVARWQPVGDSPPRAHNHMGPSSHTVEFGCSSAVTLPRPAGSLMRHAHRLSEPTSLLDRFGPVMSAVRERFDLMQGPPPVQDVSMEPTSTMPGTGGPSMHGGQTGKAGRTIKSYHCRMCEQEFANKSDMQRHAKEAHRMEEKGHKCPQCFKSFPSSQQLAQHSLVHTNVRKYACNYCDKAFKQLSHVQQHQRIHTGERPYRCPVDGCAKAFRQLSSLQQHLKGHNIPLPKSYPVSRASSTAAPPLESPSSGSPTSGHESSTGNKLNSNLARPHDLTCQVCEKHCADEVRFFCHIHKYHPDYWRVFSGGRPLSDFIETTSTPSASLRETPSQREKRYACTVCHKRYSHETGYVKHMAVHPGFASDVLGAGSGRVALYNCAVCAKLFTKEAYLLRHMEMKLDPAHAAGLDELKKSSGMFRTGGNSLRPSTYLGTSRAHESDGPGVEKTSRPASAEVDDRVVSPRSSCKEEMTSARCQSDTVHRQVSRSASCVSPLSSVSSASPASPPSFMPYSATRDEARRTPFAPDALHYPQPLVTSDYLPRHGVDAYRTPPYPQPAVGSRSPPHDEDNMQNSSPEVESSREVRSQGNRYPDVSSNHHRMDFFSPPSPYNKFQSFPSPMSSAIRSGVGSPVTGSSPFVYPQYSLYDTYLRRSGEPPEREVIHGFR